MWNCQRRINGGGSEEGSCRKFRMSLYGTRDASVNSQQEVRKFMVGIGFRPGGYNPCTYYHKSRNLRTLAHGDDFATARKPQDCEWLQEKMRRRFEIKTMVIGGGEKEQREGRILNRVVRWTEKGWEYEADRKHADILVERLGMKEAKAVATPGEEVKAELRELEQDD